MLLGTGQACQQQATGKKIDVVLHVRSTGETASKAIQEPLWVPALLELEEQLDDHLLAGCKQQLNVGLGQTRRASMTSVA